MNPTTTITDNMKRETIQTILRTIENMSIEDLRKYPELERAVPALYDMLQIDDVCDHKFVNGVCVCGVLQEQILG